MFWLVSMPFTLRLILPMSTKLSSWDFDRNFINCRSICGELCTMLSLLVHDQDISLHLFWSFLIFSHQYFIIFSILVIYVLFFLHSFNSEGSETPPGCCSWGVFILHLSINNLSCVSLQYYLSFPEEANFYLESNLP